LLQLIVAVENGTLAEAAPKKQVPEMWRCWKASNKVYPAAWAAWDYFLDFFLNAILSIYRPKPSPATNWTMILNGMPDRRLYFAVWDGVRVDGSDAKKRTSRLCENGSTYCI
jgi:hypothetical protein